MKTFDFDPRDPAFYNPLINGNFDFWQRATTLSKTQASGNYTNYAADKFRTILGAGGATKSVTINRSTNVPTVSGIPAIFSKEVVNNTAVASFGASDYINAFNTYVEGMVFAPIAGRDFTVGFWMFSSASIANFPICFAQIAASTTYVTHISVATGWNYYTVVIPWHSSLAVYDTNSIFSLNFGFIGGTSFHASALNSWVSGAHYTHSTSTNFWASTITLRFAQIQIRSGQWSKDDLQNNFVRAGAHFLDEFRLCQRYYETNNHSVPVSGNDSGVFGGLGRAVFNVPKRANPTVVAFGNGNANQARNDNNGGTEGALVYGASTTDVSIRSTSALTAGAQFSLTWTADADY